MDKAFEAHGGKGKRCDFIVFLTGPEGELVAAPLELKSGGVDISDALEQLQGGAAFAQRFAPDAVCRPILFHGKAIHPKDRKTLNQKKVRFRGVALTVKTKGCDQHRNLMDALREPSREQATNVTAATIRPSSSAEWPASEVRGRQQPPNLRSIEAAAVGVRRHPASASCGGESPRGPGAKRRSSRGAAHNAEKRSVRMIIAGPRPMLCRLRSPYCYFFLPSAFSRCSGCATSAARLRRSSAAGRSPVLPSGTTSGVIGCDPRR